MVVLPGIGGSVLAEDRGAGRYHKVWDAGFVSVAEAILQPDELDVQRPVVAVGAIRSKKLLPGWTLVHGYEGLVRSLAGDTGVIDWGDPAKPVPDADVVVFGYDWRRSIVDAAHALQVMVASRLAGLSEAERAKRVVVVAHSMGGLVARYWLGPLGGWPWCHSLVTLGTPHRGAPKALDTLVNGVRLRKPLVDRFVLNGATELLRTFPSMWELLPRYPMVARDGVGVYPEDLPLDDQISGWAQQAGAGFGVHTEIEQAWQDIPRSGPLVVPVMGWNNATLASATWSDEAPEPGKIVMSEAFPQWLGLPEWEHDAGDGTVPMLSAVPIELDEQGGSWHRTIERHGPLAADTVGAEVTDDITRPGPSTARHLLSPTAGLVVEEWSQAGSPIPVAVDLRLLPTLSAAITVTVRPDKPQAPITQQLKLDDIDNTGRAQGQLDPLPAGRYQLEVMVTRTAAGDLPRLTDAIDIVD